MPDAICPVRLKLSEAVVAAVKETYRTSADYKAALAKKTGDSIACAVALSEARDRERAAERGLRDHIEEHGCKL